MAVTSLHPWQTNGDCLTWLQQPTQALRLQAAAEIADYAACHAAAIDCLGGFPAAEFERLADAGLLLAPLHSDLGGWGLGFQAEQTGPLLQILKQIGRGNLSLGRVYEGHVNALQLIQTFATPEQVQKFARDAHERRIFGVWNAEAEDGVKLWPLGGGSYRLEGCKTFCSGCGHVERPFVNGVLPDGGWQMCIVPMEQVSVAVDPDWWQPAGMKASASYKVDFSGVELSAADLIGQPGDYFRQPWLTAGVIRFAAVQLGGAAALFDATRTYLQEIGRTDHPYQQARLGQMAIALEQGNLWLQGGAAQIEHYGPVFGGLPGESQPETPRLTGYANMVRTAIEQICMDVIPLAERCVGTRGLLPPHPMERIIRDLTLYLRQPAFDSALANVGQYVLAQKVPGRQLWASAQPEP
ncbi:MAG: acyl-CoA dehydrogenase family protein [Leptolyngbyaceae cyanobacterium SM1_1_3]|nr:acyl-CoA dehydrogenase family protein [Leptolyngbyaceae cyanobacterium SM1_1_3]NJN02631.1 acyl-CoA dehydrogenase family protein [Leptolyngbyaceae cyanobacterium RM1_1_2]NJO09965.1 acyl-CoA dehydrogenase family protein [Leptolyngbyaceae cyanobacterium SL_1_1]